MSPIFALLSLCCLACSAFGSNNVYHLNERDFEGYIRDKDIMLVDFFAPWCHHCQELSPELDAAADQFATKNQFVFAKVDCVNDGKELCQRFDIQGYPTIKLFKYGQYVGDYVGQRDRGSLMQYVDSVASTVSQHAPLTSGVTNPATLAQAIHSKPQAAVFPSHLASSIHAPAPAIAPTYMNQANTHAKNPSLMASFYGSSAHAHYPPHAAAYLGNAPPLQQASPDSLQTKFGNLASLDIYRSKLKMIAAYKNYQRRLKEYRQKLLTATKANVKPGPQNFAGAVTQPPRPGVNAFAQPQTYRGYYRPEAMAAQNVQINRAYPQVGYGGYTSNYASPYGYQALASSPYYRSKMNQGGKRHRGKNGRPAPRPARMRKPAYNRQHSMTQVNNQAARYYKQQQFRLRQQQKPQQQFQQDPQQPQQQLHQKPAPAKQLEQAYKKPQAPQPEAPPTLLSPSQSNDDPLKATDTSALKDLKADIESAIQDALKNAVAKDSDKTKPSTSVHVDGARAKPQAKAAHSDQSGSGSGAQSQAPHTHGSNIEDAVTGEGSGSGAKPDSQ